jgi:radical SAM protein with 4Fe4S-binding SPASM domain
MKHLIHYYTGIIRKLTFTRVLNYLKLRFGYHLSLLTKRPRQFGMPLSMSVEPTTSCNLRCPQCPSGLREFSRPTGMLQSGMFERIINQVHKHLHSLTFYFQGEPFLNPDFLDMVAFANARNIYTMTSTNGHFLNKETSRRTIQSGLDKLIISIDGTSEDTYKEYRVGGSLAKVLDGTREILRQKRTLKSKTPHVVWQFIVFSHNEHEIGSVKELAREIGVDEIKIKTAQIYDTENGGELIPEDEKYSRYAISGKNLKIKNDLHNECWRMWQGCVVTWDGKVVPCCFDKDAHYKVGDLSSGDFRQIWNSAAYNSFRQSVLKGRKDIDICKNCSEGSKVWS